MRELLQMIIYCHDNCLDHLPWEERGFIQDMNCLIRECFQRPTEKEEILLRAIYKKRGGGRKYNYWDMVVKLHVDEILERRGASDDDGQDFHAMAIFCAAQSSSLSENQRDFIKNMVADTKDGRSISEKQEKYLTDLYNNLQRRSCDA